jgi:hypothetical protein
MLITAEDSGQIVVSASHGGVSSAELVLKVPVFAVFFNDAGFGKEDAGAAALEILNNHGTRAMTISHLSARIGDVQDHWNNGLVSRANLLAQESGVRAGQSVREAARHLALALPNA